MIGIATVAEDDPVRRAKEYAAKHKLTFPVLVDAKDSVAKWFGFAVPTHVIVGRDGKIAHLQAGPLQETEFLLALQSALRRRK